MKNNITDYIKYKFHNTLSKGTIALLIWLGIISALLIILTSFFVKYAIGYENLPFIEIIWMALMRTLDPGTMGGDEGNWPFLLSMFFITMVGIFLISILIGIITTGIEAAIESLRKGRSIVIEKNHTVILGWSDKVFPILTELVIANNQYSSKFVTVILASKDKIEMEDAILEKIGKTGNTSIICRTGNPAEIIDLQIVNLESAKSIIILPPEKSYADINVIKTVMAILNSGIERSKPFHIVTEARYDENLKIIKMIGKDQVIVILSNRIVSKVIAQTCRQPGLSVVYSELLSFNGKSHYKDIWRSWYKESSGDEIYFHEEENLVDKSYNDALFSYDTSSVIGIYSKETGIILNPSMDYTIKPKDKIILIAEDAEKIMYSGTNNHVINSAVINFNNEPHVEDHILIINWNRYTPMIIREIDDYVLPGSEISILYNYPGGLVNYKSQVKDLSNLKINYIEGDPTNRQELDSLDINKYDNLIVLSDLDKYDIISADSRTLITLLHVRDICDRLDKRITIISQILDEKNRQVAEQTKADDFIVSEKLVSQFLTQISENKFLFNLFMELFSAEGCEIYFKPITNYIDIETEVNIFTLIQAASEKGETAIGYRISHLFNNPDQNYGVSLNPNKTQTVKFNTEDKLIVISEE